MVPIDPHLLEFMTMNSLFLHWVRAVLYPVEYGRNDYVWLRSPGHKRDHSFSLGLMDHSLWGRPAAMLWGHSSSPSGGPWGKKVKSSANNQHQLDSHVNEHFWHGYCSPNEHLACNLIRDLKPDHPAKQLPNSWTSGVVKILIDFCGFKSQILGLFATQHLIIQVEWLLIILFENLDPKTRDSFKNSQLHVPIKINLNGLPSFSIKEVLTDPK